MVGPMLRMDIGFYRRITLWTLQKLEVRFHALGSTRNMFSTAMDPRMRFAHDGGSSFSALCVEVCRDIWIHNDGFLEFRLQRPLHPEMQDA